MIGILDALGIGWAVVMGDRAGAELAWELTATRLGRFVGLVVIDRGHPRASNYDGAVTDGHCPPVEIGTTVLVSSPAARAVAQASQRYVYADYRGGAPGAAQRAGVDGATGRRDHFAHQ